MFDKHGFLLYIRTMKNEDTAHNAENNEDANLANEEQNLTASDDSYAKKLAKQTIKEFLKSILVGIFPVLVDLIFSTLVFYLFYAKNANITFKQLLFENDLNIPQSVTAAGTAVGYGVAAVLAYLLSVFFVFDNKKQGRTVKGIILFILVEGFAYGFNILLGWLFNMFIPSSFAFILRIAVSYVVVFTMRKFLIFTPSKNKSDK